MRATYAPQRNGRAVMDRNGDLDLLNLNLHLELTA